MSKKNKEYVVIVGILLALITAYFAVTILNKKDTSGQQIVEVRLKDEVLMSFDIDIDEIYTLDVELGHLHIEVKDGKYRVFDVDCPDKICEKVGWVKKGDPTLIVCLPNNIVIVQI